jgi:hypothetical protein
VGHSNVNLSPLAVISCSRIYLVQGGVYYLPCGGWALVCKQYMKFNELIIHYIDTCLLCGMGGGGVLVVVYCLSFLLVNTRHVSYLMAMWWVVFIVLFFIIIIIFKIYM